VNIFTSTGRKWSSRLVSIGTLRPQRDRLSVPLSLVVSLPQMTAMEGPASCTGMEYPMLNLHRRPRGYAVALLGDRSPSSGTCGSRWQWSSDERRFAWMDEGLTRFNQAQGMQDIRGYDPGGDLTQELRRSRGRGFRGALMRHADLYPYGSSAYACDLRQDATNMSPFGRYSAMLSFFALPCIRAAVAGETSTPYDFWNTLRLVLGTRSLLVLANLVVRT